MDFYNKFKDALTSVPSDKYLHALVGLLVAFLTAAVSHAATGDPRWSGALLGLVVAVIAGFIKENVDALTAPSYEEAERWSLTDWLATIVGGIVGAGLFII